MRSAFAKRPSSGTCKAYAGSTLCRWEVHQFRQQLWTKVARFFRARSGAYSTLVLPRRLVAHHQLASLHLNNEKWAMQRLLRKVLPNGTALA